MSYRRTQEGIAAPGFFWTPPERITEDMLVLVGAEARHAARVCRLHKGELMTVCDGLGNAFDCEIVRATPREVAGRIIKVRRRHGEPLAQVTLAVGVGKPQTFDWIVEKAVELGVVRIIPLLAERSLAASPSADAERRRVDRWQRLALGAMKQSLRSVWPSIDGAMSPRELARQMTGFEETWLADADGSRLLDIEPELSGRRSALVIVGPEAGLAPGERQLLLEAGARPVRLGARRLRAETAVVAALTLVMHHLGEV